MIRQPPISTLFPTRRSSDLPVGHRSARQRIAATRAAHGRPVDLSVREPDRPAVRGDRKSTRLNSSHSQISYAVFCLKKKKIADAITHAVVRDYTLKISFSTA